jgi:hypothetical protein
MERELAKARKPMPSKTSTPLNSKMLPIKIVKKNDELREQVEEHRLLSQEDD